jgi:hypothetical protein
MTFVIGGINLHRGSFSNVLCATSVIAGRQRRHALSVICSMNFVARDSSDAIFSVGPQDKM